jgi:hypothetical protein
MKLGEETTLDPIRAVQIAFDIELPRAKPITLNIRPDRFYGVARSFGAKRLLRGPENAIRELVRKNLDKLSNLVGFQGFRVDWFDDSQVMVCTFFPHHIIAVRIWKTDSEYFFRGSDEFMESDSARDPRVQLETSEKDEAELHALLRKLIESGMQVQCNLCKQTFPLQQCQDIRTEIDYVSFECPNCQIRQSRSLP